MDASRGFWGLHRPSHYYEHLGRGKRCRPQCRLYSEYWHVAILLFLVGQYLVKLKKEIAELRERLDAADHRSESSVASSEHRPENDSGEQGDAGKPEPVAS